MMFLIFSQSKLLYIKVIFTIFAIQFRKNKQESISYNALKQYFLEIDFDDILNINDFSIEHNFID